LGPDDQREPDRDVDPAVGRAASGGGDRGADNRDEPHRGCARPGFRYGDRRRGMMAQQQRRPKAAPTGPVTTRGSGTAWHARAESGANVVEVQGLSITAVA